jgi:hypothetical protein
LSVQYNGGDRTYKIERGDTVLCGIRGRRKDEEAVEEKEPNDSGKYAFQIFKKIMSRLGRHPSEV